jgi:hypothetical protein
MLLISCAQGVVIMKDIKEYEKNQGNLAFVKAIVQGLADIKEGNAISLSEAKKRLGIK